MAGGTEELTLARISRASLVDDLRAGSDGAGVSWHRSGLFRSARTGAHDSSRLLRRIPRCETRGQVTYADSPQ
jgi:hypothetical protein